MDGGIEGFGQAQEVLIHDGVARSPEAGRVVAAGGLGIVLGDQIAVSPHVDEDGVVVRHPTAGLPEEAQPKLMIRQTRFVQWELLETIERLMGRHGDAVMGRRGDLSVSQKFVAQEGDPLLEVGLYVARGRIVRGGQDGDVEEASLRFQIAPLQGSLLHGDGRPAGQEIQGRSPLLIVGGEDEHHLAR
jgi:hypothetical protein